MVKVALLTSDPRIEGQVRTWLRDFSTEIRLDKYSSCEDFRIWFEPHSNSETKIEGEGPQDSSADSPDSVPADATSSDSGTGGDTVQPIGQVKRDLVPFRLIILDLDLIDQSPIQWLRETYVLLKQAGAWDVEIPTRTLAMEFDSGRFSPEMLRHEIIDDIVFKPLDQSLVQQKIEFLIADNPEVSPSFLFRQKSNEIVEAGKDVMIDELSDHSLAIRNPAPLVEGLFAIVRNPVFGDSENSRVIGRVYKCARHPSLEGLYIVYLAYFGMNVVQLNTVRKYLRDHKEPSRARPSGAGLLRKKPAPPPPESMKKIAVIDMNRDTYEDVKGGLETAFLNVTTQVFPSYHRFVGEFAKRMPKNQLAVAASGAGAVEKKDGASLEADGKAEDGAKSDATKRRHGPALPNGQKLIFILSGGSHELIQFDFVPRPGQTILGREVKEWMEQPEQWLSSIFEDDREEFTEFLTYVESGARGHAHFRMKDASGRSVYFDASGYLEKTGEQDGVLLLKIEIKEVDEETWHGRFGSAVETSGGVPLDFDVIFIDGSVLREEPEAWLDGLRSLMTKAGVLSKHDPLPRIVVMADPKSRIKPEQFRHPAISGFLFKALDRKHVVQTVQALVPGLIRTEEHELNPYLQTELGSHLAKEVSLAEVSEYGLVIKHPSPFKPKSFMRFFSPLFSELTNGVLSRCTHCVKVEDDKKHYYDCHFIFFGASDELLKRIRTWIREDYVSKKEGPAA